MKAIATRKTVVLKGVGVSPGIASGRIYVLNHRMLKASHHSFTDKTLIEDEVNKFNGALESSARELLEVKEKLDDPEGIGPPHYRRPYHDSPGREFCAQYHRLHQGRGDQRRVGPRKDRVPGIRKYSKRWRTIT